MRVAAAAIVVLVLALPSWGAEPRRATLRLATTAPLIVRGVGFADKEHVALTASTGARQVASSARATKQGRFTAIFPIRLRRCTELTVRAVGSSGSRAILQRDPGC